MQLSPSVALWSLLPAVVGLAGLYLLFRRRLSLPRESVAARAFRYGFPAGSMLVVAGLAVGLVAATTPAPIRGPTPLLAQDWLVDGGVAATLLGLVVVVGVLLAITVASMDENYR